MPISTLFEYYQSLGQRLPSIAERAKIYESFGLGSADTYRGTAIQNTNLLKSLQTKLGPVSSVPAPTIPETPTTQPTFVAGGDIYGFITNDRTGQQIQIGPYPSSEIATQAVGQYAQSQEGRNFYPINVGTGSGARSGRGTIAPVELKEIISSTIKPSIPAPEIPAPAVSATVSPLQAPTVPDIYSNLFNIIDQQLKELQRRGQMINPNIEITPERTAEFMAQAAREIDPFYANQLKIAKNEFLQSLGYTQREILRQEEITERRYGKAFRELGEREAEAGFALSGRRILGEQELARTTQEEIEGQRRRLGFQTGVVARELAGKFGPEAVSKLTTFEEAPQIIPGELKFERGKRQLPFYELSPEVYEGLVGSEEFERRGVVRKRASELEEAFRTQKALEQARLINL